MYCDTLDPRTDIAETPRRELIIDPGRTEVFALHLFECSCTGAERIVDILVGACTVAVDEYGEAVDAELGHRSIRLGMRKQPMSQWDNKPPPQL
jgi:hypothetical protein